MAIAFDAATSLGNGTGNLSATHTPVGTPKGALVFIVQAASNADHVTSVTYGGTAMSRVAVSDDTLVEPGRVYAYFLGSSIPTGAQTVTVNAATSTKFAAAITVTAGGDTGLINKGHVGSDFAGFKRVQEDATNPSVTFDLSPVRTAYIAAALFDGGAAVSDITVSGAYTDVVEFDFGISVGGIVRANAQTTGDVTVGWTAALDDVAMLAVAIEELATISGNVKLSGSNRQDAIVTITAMDSWNDVTTAFMWGRYATDASGNYSVPFPTSLTAEVSCSYDNGTKYNSPSRPFVEP